MSMKGRTCVCYGTTEKLVRNDEGFRSSSAANRLTALAEIPKASRDRHWVHRASAIAAWFLLLTMTTAVVWATPAFAQGRHVVPVSTVDELYAAVNNPANEEALVELAAGTYPLDPTKPNDGYLTLQAGMDLVGQNETRDLDGDGVPDPIDPNDPDRFVVVGTETIIDARNLSAVSLARSDCHGNPFTVFKSVIAVGRGNRVTRLTVRDRDSLIGGRPFLIGFANVAPSNQGGSGLQAEVSDCILENSRGGVSFSNLGREASGFASRVTLERNVIRLNISSIIIANAATCGASMHTFLRGNRVYSNSNGLVGVGGGSADDSEVHLVSLGNVYGPNRFYGCLFSGGQDAAGAGLSKGGNRNRLWWSSVSDAIWKNGPGAGGVFAAAGFGQVSSAERSFDNQVRLEFLGTRFVKEGGDPQNRAGGARRDLTIFGAFGSQGLNPGEGNAIDILVRGATSDGAPGAFVISDSLPAAPNNTATVIGSDVAFEHANDDVDIPPEGFFWPPLH